MEIGYRISFQTFSPVAHDEQNLYIPKNIKGNDKVWEWKQDRK